MNVPNILRSDFWLNASPTTYREATNRIAYIFASSVLSATSIFARELTMSAKEFAGQDTTTPSAIALGVLALASASTAAYQAGKLSTLTTQLEPKQIIMDGRTPDIPQLASTIPAARIVFIEAYPAHVVVQQGTQELR